MTTRAERIEVLIQAIDPKVLKIIDESYQHHVPQGGESHFKLLIVSSQFETLTRIQRHKLVHKLLASEFAQGLHALSLNLFTPQEWEKNAVVPDTPACRGGFED